MSNNGNEFSKKYIAHYGLRTRQLPEMVEWYKKFLCAEVRHDMGFGSFMTFDDDHHRIVIFTTDDTEDKVANSAGVDHIGIGLPDFASLIENYERLKAHGIVPTLPVNHGFTTSLYYADPDGNEIELTVDNFQTKDECSAWMRTEKMVAAMNPPTFGDVFDPEELAQMFHSGASHREMAGIGRAHE
ncbi:MAG TPA: VOC family protein [Pyrinomonadaceae bacterium]|nr:VOC family protein [Pyrinomonadaceae bacterium]